MCNRLGMKAAETGHRAGRLLAEIRLCKYLHRSRRQEDIDFDGGTIVILGHVMLLIVYYVVFMIAGDFIAYFLGLFVEREWGSQVSLFVFLFLYFLFLWVSWVLAVWVTKPKESELVVPRPV
jgi:hypothetical protein